MQEVDNKGKNGRGREERRNMQSLYFLLIFLKPETTVKMLYYSKHV